MLVLASMRRPFKCGGLLLAVAGMMWAQANSCDVNSDGAVNVVDVQLITNMAISASGFTCTANVGGILGCSLLARQAVIKAALGKGCHFVYLSWSASSSSGIIGYNVYRGTSPGGESAAPLNTDGPVTGTEFVDVTAVRGTTYYYFVKATDGTFESPPSPEKFATAL